MRHSATSLVVLVLLSALTGCAVASQFDQSLRGLEGQSAISLGDGNTNFFARDRFDGFDLTINYRHPQQGVSDQVTLDSCRQKFDLAAVRAAQMRGRFISRIDNRLITSRVRPSFDAPGFSECTMSAPTRYTG